MAFTANFSTQYYGGLLEFFYGLSVDFVIVFLIGLLFIKAKGQQKKIFAILCIAFIFSMICNVNYNITVNILGITNFTNIIDSIFDVPFLIFLFLLLFVLIVVFLKAQLSKDKMTVFMAYLPMTIIALIILAAFFFSINWGVYSFSLISVYIIIETVLQAISFVFALLCLSITVNKPIRYILVGYLVIIASDFLIHSYVLSNTLKPRSFLDAVWSLGSVLILFGFYGLLKSCSNYQIKQLFGNINSIQARISLWNFLLSIVAVIVFWIIACVFVEDALLDPAYLQYFSGIIIVFSIFAILLSTILAKVFSLPFQRIEKIISSYMEDNKYKMFDENHKINIAEFINLEKFLNETFRKINEKNNAIKSIGAGIAHELRTPVRSIISGANGLEKYLPALTEAYNLAKEKGLPVQTIYPHQLDLLYGLTERLKNEGISANNIVDMLLMNIKEAEVQNNRFSNLSVQNCIMKALDRYSFQAGERELVHIDIKHDFYFCGDELLVIHIIFNLIKNALYYIADAEKGEIFITIEQGEGVNKLYFKDTGKGISQKILPSIFDYFFSQTENGTGIGLSSCKIAMQRMGGNITCQSEVGQFTEFLLIFPVIKSNS